MAQDENGIRTSPWEEGARLPLPNGRVDALHERFRLPCPGSLDNTVVLPAEHTLIFSPTNTGTCPCAIFLGSMDADGHIIGSHIRLLPGESVRDYKIEPGAVRIVAACSNGCIDVGDCYSELTISRGVA